jgi:glycosyltransferase involved in cell wall biosynthesis
VGGFYERSRTKLRIKEYIFEGVPIFAIERNTFGFKTADIYFDPEDRVYPLFKECCQKLKPDIVHFHHLSPSDILAQMKAAKEIGLPLILTYHSPMMTCQQAYMLYLGQTPCDGKIEYRKCLICAQVNYGIPIYFARVWAGMPKNMTNCLGRFIANTGLSCRFATWLQLPWLTREIMDGWRSELKMIDHFVAVCQWVYELLIKNNIPPEKITLCRHGIIGQTPPIMERQRHDILRLGYLGRIHHSKGIEVLLKAFKLLPYHYNKIELYIYGLIQDEPDKRYLHKLLRLSASDQRIKWMGILSSKEKFQVLNQLDILVIPSLWLETGPLVLLESWAVGTPVIGTNRGGIAELIKNRCGGLLFNSGDASDLARVITEVYDNSDLLTKLRISIPKVRTMKEVADDMESLYQRLKSAR